MRYETGIEFGGRYTLGDRIAVGGMGEVWRARDKVLARQVAIKLLSPTLATQPGFAQRFREEARNTAALGHPNIASVYDYGEDAGAHWLVMELVEGQNLAQIIRDQGRIAPEQASSILSQAALGLQAAHDGGVIHRDIKPANIIIRRDGVVKLTDFGISRAVDAVPITRTGEVMGTAQYISPEQATGQSIGPASDIYSLGVVAYEMVTGKRPFDESSPVATAMAHVQEPPPPLPPDVPEPLATVIMQCLAKSPQGRPPSAGEVARILTSGGSSAANLLATQKLTSPMATRAIPATPPPVRSPQTAPRPAVIREDQRPPARNLGWVWALVAVLAVVGGVWAAIASGMLSRDPGTGSSPSSSATTSNTITVSADSYVGRQLSEVQADLAQLGLLTSVSYEYSTFSRGTVIRVSNPGSHIRGDAIALVVSQGQQPTATPTTSTSTPEPTRSQEERRRSDDSGSSPRSSEDSGDTSPGNDNQGSSDSENPGNQGSSAADSGGENSEDSTQAAADSATLAPAAPISAHSTDNYLIGSTTSAATSSLSS